MKSVTDSQLANSCDDVCLKNVKVLKQDVVKAYHARRRLFESAYKTNNTLEYTCTCISHITTIIVL